MYSIEKLLLPIVRQSHFNKYIPIVELCAKCKPFLMLAYCSLWEKKKTCMLGHPNFQKYIPADDTALYACVTLAFEADDPTSQHQGRASGPAKGILKIWTALLTNLTKITPQLVNGHKLSKGFWQYVQPDTTSYIS